MIAGHCMLQTYAGPRRIVEILFGIIPQGYLTGSLLSNLRPSHLDWIWGYIPCPRSMLQPVFTVADEIAETFPPQGRARCE